MALLAALRSERPAMPMLITHAGGETGSAAWHNSNGASSDRSQSDWAQSPPWRAGDREVWAPLDLNGAAGRFVGHFAPAVGVLLGMAWPPTLLQQTRRAGVAMLLAQGRIDDCSGPRARLSARLRALGLRQLAAVLVSSAYEQRQFQSAGAARVQLVGNPAFDATPPARQVARGLQWRQRLSRPALVAMGTDAASEAQLLRRWKAMPGPRALLVLVPQDPQRCDELVRQWRAAGWRVARRSRWASHPGEADLQADLWLADLAGEAATLYAMADAAMLASSFSTDAGLQPMLAVACGCPLVIGSSAIRSLVMDPVGQTAPVGGQADPWSELLLATGALRHADSVPQALDMALHMALAPQRNQWVQEGLRFAQTHRDAAHRVVVEALAHARPDGQQGRAAQR